MMDKFAIDVSERLARIETSIEYIKTNLSDLPQSPECKHEFEKVHEELSALRSFEQDIKSKIAYVGGVVMMLSMAIPHFISWVISHLSLKLN